MPDEAAKSVLLGFWDRTAPSTCIEWQGPLKQDGYGAVSWEGQATTAHRVAYTLAKGLIPDGLQVRHTCDNRRCCNPDHLILGTQRENMADRRERPKKWGWGAKGEASGKAKLTNEQVIDIRLRYAMGETAKAIAKDIGMSHSAVQNITSRRTWTHI